MNAATLKTSPAIAFRVDVKTVEPFPQGIYLCVSATAGLTTQALILDLRGLGR